MTVPLEKTEDLRADVNALQRGASDPSRSVWVGASAGSGKTKVLADRVLRLLLSGAPPQRILCLTFTRAAAAEMSVRLMRRLSAWAISAEEALEAELASLEGETFDRALLEKAPRLFAEVLACPGGMRIQTIHGFAQEILRRFPLEANLPPQFTVIEEAEAEALRREATNAAFESLAEGEEAWALEEASRLMAEQSLRSLLRGLEGAAGKIEEAFRRYGGPKGLEEKVRTALGLVPGEDEKTLCAAAARGEGADFKALKNAARLAYEKGSPQPKGFAERILNWLALDEEGREREWDLYAGIFLTQKGQPNKKLLTDKLRKEFPEVERAYKDETNRILLLAEKREACETARGTKAVLLLSLRAAQSYARRKSARAALDYDDLIRRACELLSRPGIAPWVLFKLDGGIDHILVDEAQDTNEGQWRIVQALVEDYCAGRGGWEDRNRTLFVVGDEKQSIFRFQGADPESFFRMRETLGRRFHEAKKPFDEIALNVSFRSAPAILKAVDEVFADEAVRKGVSHVPVSHRAFRVEAEGEVEVWPLLLAEKDETDEEEAAPKKEKTAPDWSLPAEYETVRNPAAELAKKIAASIAEGIESGQTVFDRGAKRERPMNAGDVMILVRQREPLTSHLVRELKRRGLPVSGVDRMRLSDQLAVMDVLALLQFALLPQDDLTLATLLRGPFVGASEDDLMALAIGRKGSLWESLSQRGEEAYVAWTAWLRAVLALADAMPPLPMLMKILSEPCPADSFCARRAILRRLGPDAEDPLDELLAEAADFSARRSPSLQAFLQEMLTTEREVKRELEQAMGRVRITTVHASKGLEAPIVILPDTTGVPKKDKMSKLIWNEEGLPFYVPREPQGAALRAIRDPLYEKDMEEHRRLLYVALTRAADRLVICGYAKSEKLPEQAWYKLITRAFSPIQAERVGEDKNKRDARLRGHDGGRADFPPSRHSRESRSPVSHSFARESAPSWLFSPPPPEPSPPRPLVPSLPDEEEPTTASPRDERFARGRLIHRLLQGLPDVEASRREAAARRFLSHPQHDLTKTQQEELEREVLRLLADGRFAPFFGPESRAEAPIVGLSGARIVSGQVDRLALVDGEVWILDYKTNRPPPENVADVPALYRSQMEAYRGVLRQIYPDRTVRCFLLWTYALRLMELLPEA